MRVPILIGLLFIAAGPASGQEAGDAGKGRAYAERRCAECHGINSGDVVSPVLGLATFKEIASTPGMTGTALAVWLRTPHRAMPNLIIETQDRLDVIAYILSLREPR